MEELNSLTLAEKEFFWNLGVVVTFENQSQSLMKEKSSSVSLRAATENDLSKTWSPRRKHR